MKNHLYLSLAALTPALALRFPPVPRVPPEIWRYLGLLEAIGFPKARYYTLISEGTLAGGS